jgi:hypothetical protein
MGSSYAGNGIWTHISCFCHERCTECPLLVLLALFAYAVAAVTICFNLFLSELAKEKAVGTQILFNSLFVWLVTIVTAVVSGYMAAFFRISPSEDLVVVILPLMIMEILRLGFVRNIVFFLRFSEVEQAGKFLSLSVNQFAKSDPFSSELREMQRRIDDFFVRFISLEHQQLQIISDLKSRKEEIIQESKSLAKTTTPQPIPDLQIRTKEDMNVVTYGPFYVENRSCYAVCRKCGDTARAMDFLVFEVESKTFSTDPETNRRIALCTTLFQAISNDRASRVGTHARVYIGRLGLFLLNAFQGVFSWSFVRETSFWVSKFDDLERTKHEGSMRLDMTGLLNAFAQGSLSYIDLALLTFEEAFFRSRSYKAASSIIEFRKRKLPLCAELVRIWK